MTDASSPVPYPLITVAIAAACTGLGYLLGSTSAKPPSSSTIPSSESAPRLPVPSIGGLSVPALEDEDESSEDEDEEEQSKDSLAAIKPEFMEPCKLVLVVRTDLGMTKGKIAAQCGHATLACYKSLVKANPGLVRHWERTGQAKIAVKCDSEDELLLLQATAQSLNICAQAIQDAGRTQIAAGSRTVLGLGPAPVRLINQVTGALKLL